MLIGYARVSKHDGSQSVDAQLDALAAAGVEPDNIYTDHASGKQDGRPGLANCMRALRAGDTLVIWKLDRLGRDLKHLMATIELLSERGINFKVLAGAPIDTSTSSGRLVLTIFAALAEFERALIVERTKAGLAAARARGRFGGGRTKVTKSMLARMQAAMADRTTSVTELADELGIARSAIYRYVDERGNLRRDGERLLAGEMAPPRRSR